MITHHHQHQLQHYSYCANSIIIHNISNYVLQHQRDCDHHHMISVQAWSPWCQGTTTSWWTLRRSSVVSSQDNLSYILTSRQSFDLFVAFFSSNWAILSLKVFPQAVCFSSRGPNILIVIIVVEVALIYSTFWYFVKTDRMDHNMKEYNNQSLML